MRNASGQQGESELQWKKKATRNTSMTKFLVSTYDNSSLKVIFFLVRSIGFVAVLVAVAVYYLIHDFIFCL